ncbi:DUF4344 domain-containing metallopeptidase [Achromobacter insuavis]
MVSVYAGIMRSIFLHEFGHALIGELELPSTGAEEDAVDIYSALQIVEPTMYPSKDKEANAMVNGGATYAALQWYYSGKLAEAKGAGNSPWQDEHTGDLKRFRNMLCIMYGGNPGVFESLVQQVGFEDRTKARCADEYSKQNRAWRRILAPHTRVGAWTPDGEQPANAPGAPVNVVFEPSSRRVGNLFAINLSQPIGNNIKELGKTYVLPRPVNVVFKDCGKLNAWYSPREGTITMCYELIENIAVMVSDIEMGTVGGEPKQGGARATAAAAAATAAATAATAASAIRRRRAQRRLRRTARPRRAADHLAVLVALQGDAEQPPARQGHHDARPGGPVQERKEPAGDRHQRLERDAARCLPADRRETGRQRRGPDAERLRRLAAQEDGHRKGT